jgi:CheY-like chemotaxis protein
LTIEKSQFFKQIEEKKDSSELILNASMLSKDSNSQMSYELNQPSVKARKLRLLIANDDIFQLMIISNSLRALPFIEKIDEANNGQEALDMVMHNEKAFAQGTGNRFYDMVFLDLNMPIKNGFEACEMIQMFYLQIAKNPGTAEFQANLDLKWLSKLNELYHNMLSASETDLFESLEKEYASLYSKVKYKALDKLDRPFIFAYSALINQAIQIQAENCGFDSCLESKLGPSEFN